MARRYRRAPRPATSRVARRLATAAMLVVAFVTTASIGSASGKGRGSDALLWSALGGRARCGIANHVTGGPLQVLCEARSIPAPKHGDPTIGDPGFVYLKALHRPQLARISQYSWQKGARHGGYPSPKATPLQTGTRWKYPGLAVTCAIKSRIVRCRNEAGHGFAIRSDSYRAF